LQAAVALRRCALQHGLLSAPEQLQLPPKRWGKPQATPENHSAQKIVIRYSINPPPARSSACCLVAAKFV